MPAPLVSASETERGSELPPLLRRCGAWSEVAVTFHGYGRVGRSFVRSVGRSPERGLEQRIRSRSLSRRSCSGYYAVAAPVSPSARAGCDTRALTRAQADAYLAATAIRAHTRLAVTDRVGQERECTSCRTRILPPRISLHRKRSRKVRACARARASRRQSFKNAHRPEGCRVRSVYLAVA